MSEKKLKKIVFKSADLVPDLPENVEVDLGGKTYTARCPNDYEFYSLYTDFKKTSDPFGSDGVLPIVDILTSMFTLDDAKEIHHRLKGSYAQIDLIRDLQPAITAIFNHYEPLIKARSALIKKQLSDPKDH